MDQMLLRRLNAERFRKLLAEETDSERRRMLYRLLAEHSERRAERTTEAWPAELRTMLLRGPFQLRPRRTPCEKGDSDAG